ncbi:MAG: transferase, partial [Alphaproteobacteria bacterium]|nr:transferase [Alphaproteobacteria bacterium]
MSGPEGVRIINRGTAESAAMVAEVERAMAITTKLNRLAFDASNEI